LNVVLEHKNPSNSRSRAIKKLTGYTTNATRLGQLIFVVIPCMKHKLDDFNKMLGAESADDTKQGVWPDRLYLLAPEFYI
jgi:hypothetical protein